MAIPITRADYIYTTPPGHVKISGKVVPAGIFQGPRTEDIALLQEMARERTIVPIWAGAAAPGKDAATIEIGPHLYDLKTRCLWKVLTMQSPAGAAPSFFCNSSWVLSPPRMAATLEQTTAGYMVDAPVPLAATDDSLLGYGRCMSRARVSLVYDVMRVFRRYYMAEIFYKSATVDIVSVAENGTTTHGSTTATEPLGYTRTLAYHDNASHQSYTYYKSTPVLAVPGAWVCSQNMVTSAMVCYRALCELVVSDGVGVIKKYNTTLIWYAEPSINALSLSLAEVNQNIYVSMMVYCRDNLHWPADTVRNENGASTVFTVRSDGGCQVLDYAFKTAF